MIAVPPRNRVTEILDGLLYPYQKAFVYDDARFVAWVSSRQIGKSFALAWRALLRALSSTRRHQTIISAGREQAREDIAKVKLHAEFLEKSLGQRLVQDETKTTVTLTNGSVLRALAANPRTARGYTGDLYLDEFAHVQRDRALWAAALPLATRGELTITTVSTPMGDSGVFYDLCHPKPNIPDRVKFSLHRTTVHEAVSQGLDLDIEALKPQFDDDTWAQEYLCQFLGHVASYFPWELLRSAVVEEDDDADARIEHAPAFLGIDVGRKRDVTAIVLLRRWPGETLWAEKVDVLHKVPFDEQQRVISNIMRVHRVERCCVDATGIGMHLAENLQREFGAAVVPIHFGREVKVHLATQVRKALEQSELKLCPDGALMADAHSIERRVTSNGNLVFDATRNETGHADRFWGLALGVEAGRLEHAWDVADHGQDGGFDIGDGGWDFPQARTRAPTPAELGFEEPDEHDDIEDARDELVGDRRSVTTSGTPFSEPMPPGCLLPPTLVRRLTQSGEDPCATCDSDRRVCGGRPMRTDHPRKPREPPKVFKGDSLRDVMTAQGHVPSACRAQGAFLWARVRVGSDPCATCDLPRSLCGGRPKRGMAQ